MHFIGEKLHIATLRMPHVINTKETYLKIVQRKVGEEMRRLVTHK
jgi:hypothetical protein